MRGSRVFFLVFLFAILCSSLIMACSTRSVVGFKGDAKQGIDMANVMRNINMTNIMRHSEYFSGLGSRFTGYPGCDSAGEYIRESFESMGLADVEYQPFNVTVPVDYGANVTILSLDGTPEKVLEAYTLVPNMVQTSPMFPYGLTGRLVYIGTGSPAEMNGKDIAGGIVVMDLAGSRDNWIRAASLGAEAVVFVGMGDRRDALSKSVWVPLDFPRLFVPEPGGAVLKEAAKRNVSVRIFSSMRFERREAVNVIGFIYGEKLPDQTLIFTAYYDSYSITPRLAPGAQESLGISSLLELARLFSRFKENKNGPDRTIMFVAFAGHQQALLGAREFAELFLFERRWESKVGLMDITYFPVLINLDLAADNDWVVNLGAGDVCALSYGTRSPALQEVRWLYDRFEDVYEPEIRDAWKAVYGEIFRVDLSSYYYAGSRAPEPNPMVMDSEPYLAAGANGFSFYTAYSVRRYYATPFDVYDWLDWSNLRPQVETVFSVLFRLQAEPQYEGLATEVTRVAGRLYGANYGKLVGRAVIFNPMTNRYEGIPNALVAVVGPDLYRYILMADEEGVFTVVGITSWGYNYAIYPFWLDENGGIVYAPDFGTYGFGNTVQITQWAGGLTGSLEYPRYFTVFRCGSVALFDLVAPRTGYGLSTFQIMDFDTHATPLHYSFFTPTAAGMPSNLVVAFLEPDSKVEATVFEADVPNPAAIVLNASEAYPEGKGYAVRYGEQLLVTNTIVRNAEDMWLLDDARLNLFREYDVFEPAANQLHEEAGRRLATARAAFEKKEYDMMLTSAREALAVETRAYARALSLYNETVSSTMFFFALLVPFAFLAERLFVSSNGMRRLAGTIIIFTMALAVFALIHAGFYLGQNMLVVLIGFVAMALTLPLVPILGGYAQSKVTEWRRKVAGLHFAEISRTGASMLALSYGVQQMRKRKLRTTLTFMSILLITSSLVSMTSISATSVTLHVPSGGEPTRTGILVAAWIDPFRGPRTIPEDVLNGIELAYGGEAAIAPRLWLYNIHAGSLPGDFRDPHARGLLNVTSKDKWRTAGAILGISAQELNIWPIDMAVLKEGIWFPSEEGLFVIISETYARDLNINVSDPSSTQIKINGIEMKVCGIYDPSTLELVKDLDGRSLVPLDPSDWRARRPLYSFEIVLMPFEAVMGHLFDYGPAIFQIAMGLDDSGKVEEVAESMSTYYGFDVYASTGEQTLLYAHGVSREVSGFQFIILPAVVGVLNLLNIMLGSVFERKKEISIFGSVGLSPLHVGSMFLAEAGIYAVLGGSLGYLFGIVFASIAYRLYGVAVNYSSLMVVAVVLLSMGLTTAAVIYPIYKCARLVTPSLERRWKIPTKPRGDVWEIPLPFISTETETHGIFCFIKEFYEGHSLREESPTFFAQDLSVEETGEHKARIKSLSATVAIEPYPRGISQKAVFEAVTAEGMSNFVLVLNRLTGEHSAWRNFNTPFVKDIRRQLLIWQSLAENEKKRYIQAKL